FTVAFTLSVTVVMSKVIGGVLPMLAKRVHIDPAVMAGPLITTIVDAMSLLIYFSVATRMLGI
ncbi:MAG TPA: magnesium transporter, partial [Clostridia bacterium]|nr:magnesium transporter [Clostridia bacterium]